MAPTLPDTNPLKGSDPTIRRNHSYVRNSQSLDIAPIRKNASLPTVIMNSEKTTPLIWSIRQKNALLFCRMDFATMGADATLSIKKKKPFKMSNFVEKRRAATVKYFMKLGKNLDL